MKKTRYKIGVMGTAGRGKVLPQELLQKAKELGKEIARRGCILITGACMGTPQAATEGANEVEGLIVGFSPAANLKEHLGLPIEYPPPVENCLLIFTGMGKEGRNILSIRNCDGVVFIGGGAGTLMEFSIAYHMGKTIGILEEVEGISRRIFELFKFLKERRDMGSILVSDSDPEKLVDKIIEVVKQKRKRAG
ncbi:MAG: hypothetical protein ACE5J0_00105 [Candidatus Paceibacterales bacterium]